MGFRPAIEAILRYMPDRRDRQTLLFSATMPGDVRKIAQLALKEKYEFIDCVGKEESTHQHVPQQFVVCAHQQQVCVCVFFFFVGVCGGTCVVSAFVVECGLMWWYIRRQAFFFFFSDVDFGCVPAWVIWFGIVESSHEVTCVVCVCVCVKFFFFCGNVCVRLVCK